MLLGFQSKKENSAQFEFDDLTFENMGFNYFIVRVFRDEIVHFYGKRKEHERGMLLSFIRLLHSHCRKWEMIMKTKVLGL